MRNIDTEPQPDKYRNHAQVWALLPWYLNGSLSAAERQRVCEHAAVCLPCRKELGLQAALRAGIKQHELDELMVSASFDRLSARLREQDAGSADAFKRPGPTLWRRAGKLAGALPLRLRQFRLVYFGAAAVLALAAILPRFIAEPGPGANTFRTLSNRPAATPAADLRLIFAEGVPESARAAILAAAGLSIVSGPDERGLYFVDADDPAALAATLARLRDDDDILFAEYAIGAGPDRAPPEER